MIATHVDRVNLWTDSVRVWKLFPTSPGRRVATKLVGIKLMATDPFGTARAPTPEPHFVAARIGPSVIEDRYWLGTDGSAFHVEHNAARRL